MKKFTIASSTLNVVKDLPVPDIDALPVEFTSHIVNKNQFVLTQGRNDVIPDIFNSMSN